MAQFTTLTSRIMPLPENDVDTDQIIPAQFLKVTDKNGLADALFFNWRYNDDKSPNTDFIINKPESAGCQILLAGDNFGCGSSREHARFEPRACPVGAHRVRLPRGNFHILRGYLPQQLVEERTHSCHCG